MRKLLLSIVFSLSLFLPLFMVAKPVLAQSEEEDMLISPYESEEYDWEAYYDEWEDLQDDYTTAGALGAGGLLLGGAWAIGSIIISIVISLGVYIYMALALMNIAKRLNAENAWYAWIPILNLILLFKMGEQNPTLLLLLLIPGIGGLVVGILSIIAIMKICEKRGYDKLLGLLMLVPIANFVLLGMLAWGKKE